MSQSLFRLHRIMCKGNPKAEIMPIYRCQSVLRSFKACPDFDIAFDYPIFKTVNFQTDKAIVGSIEYASLANENHQKKITEDKIKEAIEALGDDATGQNIADYLEVCKASIYKFMKDDSIFFKEQKGKKVIYKLK